MRFDKSILHLPWYKSYLSYLQQAMTKKVITKMRTRVIMKMRRTKKARMKKIRARVMMKMTRRMRIKKRGR